MLLIMLTHILCILHGQVHLSEPEATKEETRRQTRATYFEGRELFEVDIIVQIKEGLHTAEKVYTVVAVIDNGKKYTRKSHAVQAEKEGFTHKADVEIPSLGRSMVVYFTI